MVDINDILHPDTFKKYTLKCPSCGEINYFTKYEYRMYILVCRKCNYTDVFSQYKNTTFREIE